MTRFTMAWTAILVAALGPACSKFGEDAATDGGSEPGQSDASNDGGASACVDSCSGSDLYCQTWDFAGGCPKELSKEGDATDPTKSTTAFVDCTGGALHVFGTGTLDSSASLTLRSPPTPYRVHTAATATLKEWSGSRGRRVMEISSDGDTLAMIRAESATASLVYSLCSRLADSTIECVRETVNAPKGTTHRLALDVDAAGLVTFSLDCKPVARTTITNRLETEKSFRVRFGDVDADPIDGQLDDVIIALPLL